LPSALRPGIDRRLELICLKCLAKQPRDRYASADALAADLDRWRAGEPVSVQPPALAALLRVWLRQNFGAAGWTVVVGLGLGVVQSLLLWLIAIQPPLKDLAASYRRLTGEAPWLVANWAAPSWLSVPLTLLGVIVIGFSGLITARLVRPRNRQADIAAGLVSGAVAGVVFFTLSVGWFAGMLRLEPSLKDIWLLSTAAWDGTEKATSPRSRIRAHLLEKYPGLWDVPVEERGRALHEKLSCDLFTGIPMSIWSGMLLSVGCCVGFGVFGTAMGGHLLRERGRVWKAMLPYMEGMVPAGLLCWWLATLLTPWIVGGRLNLPLWYFPLLIGVLGLAVTSVIRGWHWAARLPLHATWIILQVVEPWFEFR
jgi:hypothetical protein